MKINVVLEWTFIPLVHVENYNRSQMVIKFDNIMHESYHVLQNKCENNTMYLVNRKFSKTSMKCVLMLSVSNPIAIYT